jgi:hypothetical protein
VDLLNNHCGHTIDSKNIWRASLRGGLVEGGDLIQAHNSEQNKFSAGFISMPGIHLQRVLSEAMFQ